MNYINPSADAGRDVVMLIQQKNMQSFIAFASHQSYLAGLGHRTAALEDSRLLPMAAAAATIDSLAARTSDGD